MIFIGHLEVEEHVELLLAALKYIFKKLILNIFKHVTASIPGTPLKRQKF